MTERRKASPVVAVTGFTFVMTGLLAAATWFAMRDASMARAALAEVAPKPARRIEGEALLTTHSTYSVSPPPLVAGMQEAPPPASVPPAGSSFAQQASPPATREEADGTAAAAASPAPGPDGYIPVTFQVLAGFDYGLKALSRDDNATTGSEERNRNLPPEVRALNGRKVSVTGFMMPIEFVGGRVRSFLLMKNQLLCCFGIAPRLNDFVAVRVMDEKGIPATKDVPIAARGVLEVGEVINNGIPLALYTMRAEEVRGAE